MHLAWLAELSKVHLGQDQDVDWPDSIPLGSLDELVLLSDVSSL